MSGLLRTKQYQNLIDKIDKLTSTINILAGTISAQTDTINAQTDTINAQTDTINAQTDTINKLQDDLSSKSNDNEKLTAIIDAQNEKIKVQEERLNKNSKNSSKPPSTDGYKKPKPKSLRKASGKSAGAQNGHIGNNFELIGDPDVTIQHTPKQCEGCDLFGKCKVCSISKARYEVDIRIETITTAHKTLAFNCPYENNEIITGEFPSNINSHMQYGDKLKAFAISLNTHGMVSYKRINSLLSAVFNIPISAGTIFSMVKDLGIKLEDTVEIIRQTVSELSHAHFDETGLRVEKKLHWVHSASNDKYTFMTVEKNRGKKGIDSSGVLPNFTGIAIHDFWPSYFKFDEANHAVCNAHLLRELNGIIENDSKQIWAEEIAKLLIQMKKAKETALLRGKFELTSDALEYFSLKYDEILEIAITQNPIPARKKGQRGRVAKGKPRALADRFVGYKGEVCLFVNDFNIPFDNNLAERDIRMVKVKQKVSGSFRTKDGADTFATIMSYLGTATKHKINIFKAITEALKGKSKELIFD